MTTTQLYQNVREAKRVTENPPDNYSKAQIQEAATYLDANTSAAAQCLAILENATIGVIDTASKHVFAKLPEGIEPDSLREACETLTAGTAYLAQLFTEYRDSLGVFAEVMEKGDLRDRFRRLVKLVIQFEALIAKPGTGAVTAAFKTQPTKPTPLDDVPLLDPMLSRVGDGYGPEQVAAWTQSKREYAIALSQKFSGVELLIKSLAEEIVQDGSPAGVEHLAPHVVDAAAAFRDSFMSVAPLFELAEFRPLGKRLAKVHDVLVTLESILKIDGAGQLERITNQLSEAAARLERLEARASERTELAARN
ncbi:MAG: hypothetical protein JNJ82_15415 [Opitutaceae bacterium]|nr:hypothetical protein [Opitutaceae bacterium]